MSNSSILRKDRTYQVLPLRARVDLGVMIMKGYSAFPKAPALLEPHKSDCLVGGVLPLYGDADCVNNH